MTTIVEEGNHGISIQKCAVCGESHKGLSDVVQDIHCYTGAVKCQAPFTEIKDYILKLSNSNKNARDVKCFSCQGIFHPAIVYDMKDTVFAEAYEKLEKAVPFVEFKVPLDPFPIAFYHIHGSFRTSYFSQRAYKTEDLFPLCDEHFCTYREYMHMMEGKNDKFCPCKKPLTLDYIKKFPNSWMKLCGMNKSLS